MENVNDALLRTLLKNVPGYQDAVNMIGSRDPKQVFLDECEKRGVDPNQVLKMMGRS